MYKLVAILLLSAFLYAKVVQCEEAAKEPGAGGSQPQPEANGPNPDPASGPPASEPGAPAPPETPGSAPGTGPIEGGQLTESQEEVAREKVDQDRLAAQAIQEEIEKAHANDPKDPLQLAARTLEKAFDRYQGAGDVSVFKLLSTVSRSAGEPRLLLLRLFELMDKDMNGRISNEEFTSLYMAPVAYPDRAVELMFKLHDLDKNGFITQWEYLRSSLTVGGINQNLQDKWIEAGQKLKQQDVNGDGLVDLTEFTLFIVWQVNVGIHNQKQREQAAGVL